MAEIFRSTEYRATKAPSDENARRAAGPAFAGIRRNRSLLELEAWLPSETKAISPMVDQLMRLIEGSRCVAGNEYAVGLVLREALNNAVVHGNEMDAHKLVQVRCRCESGKGVWLTVKDQGKGFDPAAVLDAFAAERLEKDRGQGIQLMKSVMDQVCFEGGGTVVHMWKAFGRDSKAEARTSNELSSYTETNNLQKAIPRVGTHTNAVVGQRRRAA